MMLKLVRGETPKRGVPGVFRFVEVDPRIPEQQFDISVLKMTGQRERGLPMVVFLVDTNVRVTQQHLGDCTKSQPRSSMQGGPSTLEGPIDVKVWAFSEDLPHLARVVIVDRLI